MSIAGAGWSDEELLAALEQALRARRSVPDDFVQAAKNAFAWHDIDAELAELTYDSSRDELGALGTRAEAATIRALTFTSAHLAIELEVAGDALFGQVVPAQAATISVQTSAGSPATITADEIGCFCIDPIPVSPFRLSCRTAVGVEAQTSWITL